MNPVRYYEVLEDLEEAGAGVTWGRIGHLAATTEEGGMVVIDEFESLEAFERYRRHWERILRAHDLDPPLPLIYGVEHKISHSPTLTY